MKSASILVGIAVFLFAGHGYTREAIEIERINPGNINYELSISYTNLESERTDILEEVVSIGNSFIVVPRFLGNSIISLDTLVYSPSITYGITDKLNLFGGFSYLSNYRQSTGGDLGKQEDTDAYLDNFHIGIGGSLYKSSIQDMGVDTALAIGLAQASKLNETDIKFDIAKSYDIGFIVYRILDPLVLSLQFKYKINIEREMENVLYDPPDLLSISPAIKFSVNHMTTLVGGFSWTRIGESTVNGTPTNEITRTKMDINFGIESAINNHLRLTAHIGSNISGQGGANFTVGLSYQ